MGKKLGMLVGVGLLVVVAVLGYIYLSGGSGEPSAEVTAPTIASQATEPTQAARGIAGSVTYDIDKSLSSVRFELDELLGGNPNRVVGSTSEVAGQVRIDFEDPANSQVGTIVINVRTLVTDSDLRDRVMRGPILGSSDDANEFAEFNPTSLEGLPDAVAIGDTVSFTVTGDFSPQRRNQRGHLRRRTGRGRSRSHRGDRLGYGASVRFRADDSGGSTSCRRHG